MQRGRGVPRLKANSPYEFLVYARIEQRNSSSIAEQDVLVLVRTRQFDLQSLDRRVHVSSRTGTG